MMPDHMALARTIHKEHEGRHLTVRQDNGISASGRYAGHETLSRSGLNHHWSLTGRIFVLDGDTEYVGTPVAKGLSE